jgi:tetratricopeptide (TPR) repeat protein
MQPLTVRDIDERTRDLYSRADEALQQKNYDYAIDLFQNCLKLHPAFKEARESLRQATLLKFGGKPSAAKQAMVAMKFSVTLTVKIPGLIKKGECIKAMRLCEEVLANDPSNLSASRLLAEAASDAEMSWIAVDIMELAARYNPTDADVNLYLCQIYNENGLGGKAVEVCEKLRKYHPNDDRIFKMYNSSQARMAMDEGDLDGEKKEEADTKSSVDIYETQTLTSTRNTTVVTKGSDHYVQELMSGNDSIDTRKRLAREFIREGEFDQAVEILTEALDMEHEVDLQLQKLVFTAVEGRIDNALESWRNHLEQAQTELEKEEALAEIANLEQTKKDILLDRAREQVAHFPNDPKTNMAFAEILVEREMYEESLDPLTKAATSPRFTSRAYMLRGKCRVGLEIYDKAKIDLTKALDSLRPRDPNEKELHYHLGNAMLGLGDKELAFKHFTKSQELGFKADDLSLKIEEVQG